MHPISSKYGKSRKYLISHNCKGFAVFSENYVAFGLIDWINLSVNLGDPPRIWIFWLLFGGWHIPTIGAALWPEFVKNPVFLTLNLWKLALKIVYHWSTDIAIGNSVLKVIYEPLQKEESQTPLACIIYSKWLSKQVLHLHGQLSQYSLLILRKGENGVL